MFADDRWSPLRDIFLCVRSPFMRWVTVCSRDVEGAVPYKLIRCFCVCVLADCAAVCVCLHKFKLPIPPRSSLRRIASDPGATERLRETRRATVSRTRSDLAAHDVRTNTHPFLGNTEYFIFVGLPWGGCFFCTHGKVSIRRKSQQHPKRDPIVKPRRLRLCGFPRFCSVSHGYTSQNFAGYARSG